MVVTVTLAAALIQYPVSRILRYMRAARLLGRHE